MFIKIYFNAVFLSFLIERGNGRSESSETSTGFEWFVSPACLFVAVWFLLLLLLLLFRAEFELNFHRLKHRWQSDQLRDAFDGRQVKSAFSEIREMFPVRKSTGWIGSFFLFFDHYYFLFLYSFIYFLGGNKFPIQFPTTNDSHYLSFYLLLACETWQDRNSIVDSFPVLWCVHVRLLPIDAALPHLPQIAPIISNSCRLAQIHATSSSLFHFLVVWWARWHPCGGTYSNLSFNFNFLWIDRINVGIFIVFFSSSKIQLNLYSNIFPTVGRNEIKSDKVEREAIFWLDSSDVATLRRACGPIRYVAMSDLRGFSFFFVYFVCLFVLFFFFYNLDVIVAAFFFLSFSFFLYPKKSIK